MSAIPTETCFPSSLTRDGRGDFRANRGQAGAKRFKKAKDPWAAAASSNREIRKHWRGYVKYEGKSRKGPVREGMCFLCRKHRSLVKSHIIPEAFFEKEYSTRLLSNVEGTYPRRAPIGVYDRIVCATCEIIFGSHDTYASEVLLRDISAYQAIKLGNKLLALIAHDIDYCRLKLFSISVIWRASVRSHPFYNPVNLGPFEKRARDMIIAGDPGEARDFATWWSIFDMQWTPGIMDPFFERWGWN